MSTNIALACSNAAFTLFATLCMLAGYRAIRRKRVARHRFFMLSAFGFSAAFLVTFVVRYVGFGITEFTGTGVARGAFMTLLVSHEAVSVPTVALVLGTLALGLGRKDAMHRDLAKITFPLWLFVSLSGLAIFVLLYLWPVFEGKSGPSRATGALREFAAVSERKLWVGLAGGRAGAAFRRHVPVARRALHR